jgi:hypothetical protein
LVVRITATTEGEKSQNEKKKKKGHVQWVHGKGRVGTLIRTACTGLRGAVQHLQYNQYLEPGDAGMRLNTAARS